MAWVSYKIDWALREPVPWLAQDCRLAGTVHLGGTLDEICRIRTPGLEQSAAAASIYVLFAQPSLFDPTRAPAGQHTAWGYCHVPYGFAGNATDVIEDQVERFAPGFKDCILARSVMGPAELEAHNQNLVGGDIGGGATTLKQLLIRPTPRLWRTPMQRYIYVPHPRLLAPECMVCVDIMLQSVYLQIIIEATVSFNYCLTLYQTVARPAQLR